jgi:hypothetical protein
MYLARLKVEGREKLRWRGGERKAIRVALEIDRIEKDYSLSPHKKFHHGTIWVSDDDLRIPLRIEVKVFVGHVFAELVEMNAGRVPLRPRNLSEAFVEEKVARSGDEGSVDFGAEE